MSEEKLSSDEVPKRLTEWLLEMGCPPEKVPTLEKMTQMCRGQYYMVWRSLIEHVKSKEVIKNRRLQVFCDDVSNYQNRNVFSERGNNKVVPEEILLWRQQTELREKVAEEEQAVATHRQALQELTDKINKKASQRNAARESLQNLQRRMWHLTLVAEDWRNKKTNLEETKTIAESLCNMPQECEDAKSKLDKCLAVLSRPPSTTVASTSMLASNPVACSSVVSVSSDHSDEEQIASMLRIGRAELFARRAQITGALIAGNTAQDTNDKYYGVTPKSVISNTIALQSTLALEAMKNRVHIANTRKRLANAVAEINTYLSEEACELLVLRCERACSERRVQCLREITQQAAGGRGAFHCEGGAAGGAGRDGGAPARQIQAVDRSILMKKEELKRLMFFLTMTERKIQNVRECLLSVFNGFYKDVPNQDIANFKGIHLDLPQESVSSIRRFYEERKQKRSSKIELSMNLDVSDISMHDAEDSYSPRLVDELKFYLKKFNLENNRKLVLESGEKIWIFETFASSLDRIKTVIQTNESLPPLINTATDVPFNILKIIDEITDVSALKHMVKRLDGGNKTPVAVDIGSHKEEEDKIYDQIKKRLNDCLNSLQKTNKTLDLGQENLKFWSQNAMRKYISSDRRVNGKTYKEYEAEFLEILC